MEKQRGKITSVFYRLRNVVAACFFMIFLFSNFAPAIAASLDDFYKQRDYYSTQAEKARQEAEKKAQEADKIENQITQVNLEINQVESALGKTETDIKSAENTIADLEAKIKAEEDNLAREREKQSKIVASRYMEGEDGLLQAIIGSENLSDMMNRQQYYDSIKQQIELRVETIDKMKRELEERHTEQDKKLRDLSDLKNAQATQKQSLESKQWVKRRLLTDTNRMIEELKEEEKNALRKEQEAISQITKIIAARKYTWIKERGKGEKVSPGDIIGKMGSTGYSTGAHLHFEVRNTDNQTVNPASYLGSKFVWPTVSDRITQEYGWTSYARAGAYGGGMHTGLDIGAVEPGVWGDPIFAAGKGEIVYKQWYGGYGYAVIILHEDDWITLYGHLAST